MSKVWAPKFTYEHYKMMLEIIKSRFELCRASDVPQILKRKKAARLIIRHDIDVSLKKAIYIADIEKELNVRSTYMVMTNSPLYRIEDSKSRRIIRQLTISGHDIGLHYNLSEEERNDFHKIDKVKSRVKSACEQLESITGAPIKTISFHRPISELLKEPLLVSRRVNVHSRKLTTCYLSDSRGKWWYGNPLIKLFEFSKKKLLAQLLIHPIWWGNRYMSPRRRLLDFLKIETNRRSCDYVEKLNAALSDIVPAVWKDF